MIQSDFARVKKFNSFVENIKAVYTQAVLNKVQLSIYQKRCQDDLQQKSISPKRLKPFGSELGLIKKNTEEMIAEKEQKD